MTKGKIIAVWILVASVIAALGMIGWAAFQ